MGTICKVLHVAFFAVVFYKQPKIIHKPFHQAAAASVSTNLPHSKAQPKVL